jgi:hypothetical protein
MFAKILEAVSALSERVARMEEALTRFNVNGSKGALSELTETDVNAGKQQSAGLRRASLP